MSPEPPKSTASSPWPARAEASAKLVQEWVTRPRVTLCIVGTVLVLGGLLFTNSVWTMPLMILGAVMVLVAWIGHRLEGRFAVEWGKTGTELRVPSDGQAGPAGAGVVAASATGPQPRVAAAAPESEEQVIEGEAHTVEVDVGELKALIAAVEAEPSAVATEQQPQDIWIHRVVNGNGHDSSNGAH